MQRKRLLRVVCIRNRAHTLVALGAPLLLSGPVIGQITANGSRICDSTRTALAAIDASYTLADNNDKIIYAAGANDFACHPGSGIAGHTLQYRILGGSWANIPTSNGSGPFLAASGTVLTNNSTVSNAERRAKLTGDNGVYKPSAREFTTNTTLDYLGDFEDDHSEAQWALDFSTCGGGETYEFRVRWGTDDCGDQYVVYPSQITTAGAGGPATISSTANQVFFVGDPITPNSQITITDDATTPTITAANDLRVRVPSGFNMLWDKTDLSATIGGTAAAKVSSTVSYEDAGATLVLNVTGNFAAGEYVTVSDVGFMDFLAASAADNLELEVYNDDVVTATDDKSIQVGATTYRSIGTDVGTRYAFGNASTTAGSNVVTFAGGAALPADVGLGDKLTVNYGSFFDDFYDGVITGWTNIGPDSLSESGGTLRQTSAPDDSHYSIDAGAGWTDYTVTCDIMARDNDENGISFRIQDANNYYVLYQRFGQGGPNAWGLHLRKYVAGTPSDLATPVDQSGLVSEDVWYELKVELSGNNIKCYFDGALKFDVTDSTYAGGTAGVWGLSQECRWDNMLVTTGAGGPEELYVLSRDSDTQVTVQSDATGTSANQSYTIERCYNTLQAWEDDREGDLVGEGRREVGVCYNDGSFTAPLLISGSTTDADHYMHLTVAAGERHDGIQDGGACIDAQGGWGNVNAIDVEDECTRIEWLEIKNIHDAGDGIRFKASPAADNGLVASVYVHSFWQNGNAGVRTAAPNTTIRNSFFTSGTTYGILVETGCTLAVIENCTLRGSPSSGVGVSDQAGTTVSIKNTISVNHPAGKDFQLWANIAYFGNNMYSSVTGFSGPQDGGNQWPPSNLEHLFASTGTPLDLHLELSGNYAVNSGLDLSGSFTADIDGATRTDAWDMGADEARPGTDTPTPKVMAWSEIGQ